MNNYELMNRLVNVSNSHKNKKVIKGLLIFGSFLVALAIYYYNKNKDKLYHLSKQIKLNEALKAENESLKNTAVQQNNSTNKEEDNTIEKMEDKVA